MANRPSVGVGPAPEQLDRPKQLRHVSEQLAVVLESVELDDERQLADTVIEAIRAVDRAYELETADRRHGSSEEFVFPRE